jgi:hypothetical protein
MLRARPLWFTIVVTIACDTGGKSSRAGQCGICSGAEPSKGEFRDAVPTTQSLGLAAALHTPHHPGRHAC